MQDINLLAEMEQAQSEFEQRIFVEQVEAILRADVVAENDIEARISKNTGQRMRPEWADRLEPQRMFNEESIEYVCTKFRLRFLDSAFFKGDIPAEAIREIKRLESSLAIQFESFKIVAPAERFHLKDSTKDPILLAELPNGKYYYIYQWGNDMKWYQGILRYPFRHMGTLAITSTAIGLLLAILVPSQFEAMQAEFFYRFFIFSMSSCLVMTLAIITAIMYSKDFSENVWNSKFIR